MVSFTNFVPLPDQTDVAKTTLVNFTILDEYATTDIHSLNVGVGGAQVISNGVFTDGYTGNIFSSTGKYVVGIYPKRPFFRSGSVIGVDIEVFNFSSIWGRFHWGDIWGLSDYDFYLWGEFTWGDTWGYEDVVDVSADSYSYSFTISAPAPSPTPVETYSNRACSQKPYFPPTDLGLVLASDAGIGTEINLTWKTAYAYNPNDIIFYNVYYSTSYDNVFDGYPDFLVADINATIWGLDPGESHFFGVRVAEFGAHSFTYAGMQQAGPNMYFYPEAVEIDAYTGPTATTVLVNDISGFPNYGIIQTGSELIRYSSLQISPPAFIVATNGRGYGSTIQSAHYAGAEVRLYSGQEDANTTVAQANATFQKPNYALTYVKEDGYGYDGYRDGYDGYAHTGGDLRFKEEIIDSVTTDGKQNNESGDFPRYTFCGTWRTKSPQSYMQGQCVNSYLGGVDVRTDSDGNRVLVKTNNMQTGMQQREELLVETTGEPFVLIRRMWTGMRCLCFMNRREHPDARCPVCFGSSFTQGYIQFFNTRRSDRRILIRIDPTTDDLNLVDRGLEPLFEPDGWTLSFPQIKDRDIVVRFVEDTLEEWRYEILNVTRNKTLFSQVGVQKLKLKRLPKTDIIYQFPIVRNTAPYPETIGTSVNSAAGMIAHSHEIIVPSDFNINTLKVATLESQGHNHIIYNGQIQSVLNHTHIII